jgi:hypothetical protein
VAPLSNQDVVDAYLERDGAVRRETWYFGPELPAPAWRAAWVEPMGPVERSNER